MLPEQKVEIETAAATLGQSVTKFLTDAALRRAHQVKTRQRPRGVHGGVPAFFRACCAEAALGGGGYANAAWHLANAIGNGTESPYDVEEDEWRDEIESLVELISNEDTVGIWGWFKRHYPKCMKLVPTRRREQFVEGVLQAHEHGRLDG